MESSRTTVMASEQGSHGTRQTVAVVGLGAIGGVIAGTLLALDRFDVSVCVRQPIARLVVERPDDTVDRPVRALTDVSGASPVDWVLLCTKAHQTPQVAPWLERLCGAHTRVAVVQNGIGQVERVGPFVGAATVVPTIVYYNGERLAPDRVKFRRAGPYELAVRDDDDGQAFADLLRGSPMRILLSTDFATLAWRKLLINAVANPITALTLQRLAVFHRDDIKALSLAVLEEAVAVGRADGAALADDEAARTLALLLTYPGDGGTSMYFDRLAGRGFEVEALTGAIVSTGRRLGLTTPLNAMLLTLLRAASDAV